MSQVLTHLVSSQMQEFSARFNVFDVMHHGTHEKQISNVFAWLLDRDQTHGLGSRFVEIFLGQLAGASRGVPPLPSGEYWLRQEVNVAPEGQPADIADLVLENEQAAVVIENYFTSDGHGHNYQYYLDYARQGGRDGRVLLLCEENDPALQTDGWQYAAVLTYAELINELFAVVSADNTYQLNHPDAYVFITQMHEKFIESKATVDDSELLDFVIAMSASGDGERYRRRPQDIQAEIFAAEIAARAEERYAQGREFLLSFKAKLRRVADDIVVPQLEETYGAGVVTEVHNRWVGAYQWAVGIELDPQRIPVPRTVLEINYGPTPEYLIRNDGEYRWKFSGDGEPDYSHLFIAGGFEKRLFQSAVTLAEVLAGLPATDRRIHDEFVVLLTAAQNNSTH